MKSRFVTLIPAIALFATLAIPLRLAAQDKPTHKGKDHHYKLIDLGTFGGPSAVLINDCAIGGGGACGVLNNRGTVVSQADTSSPNPNYLNANPLLPPFTVPGDPFIFHAFQWHRGALQDLGTLPGGYNSFAESISPSGLIAGASENGVFDPLTGWPEAHAVLWQNNGRSITDLGTLEGGYESEAFSVNDRAQVVGFALNTISDPFGFGTQLRAFLWQNGTMQDLGTLGTGTDAQAYWVNERGQVAGVSFTNTTPNSNNGTFCAPNVPTQDPFLWDNGNLIDLGTLGGTCGVPNALNNRGQVVGQSNLAGDIDFHAFLWTSLGPMQDLGTLGGSNSTANWINDAGDVVGAADTPIPGFHAFIWRHGVMTDLGTLGAGPCSSAVGINSKRQVVGGSGDCDLDLTSHAFLWENGQMTDLNIFNHSGSGLTQLIGAYNINDRGEIVGLGVPPGVDPADVFTLGHTFTLIPCDENHPGVEGCDYSPMDTTALPQLPALPAASSRTSGQPFQLPRARSPFRNRVLGRPLVKSGIGGEGEARHDESCTTGNGFGEDDLPLPGSCQLNFGTDTMTGECLEGSRCIGKQNKAQCPPGTKGKAPTRVLCLNGSTVLLDAKSRCTP